jgi:seryl-tRNA synthetase
MPEEYREECIEYIIKESELDLKDTKFIRGNLEKQIAQKHKAKDGLIQMRSDGELDSKEFMERKNILINDINSLQEQLNKLNKEDSEIMDKLNKSVERLINIEQERKNYNYEQMVEFISDMSVELIIDNKKRLYVQLDETLETFKNYNLNKWWYDRAYRANLYKALWRQRESFTKLVVKKVYSNSI